MGWFPLRFNQQPAKSQVNNNVSHGSVVGLRILTHHHLPGRDYDNLLLVSALNLTKSKTQNQSCFLRSCSLCTKSLRLDKEVYMYRGDQGFCSVECRRRQIYLDERKEFEISTKNRLASLRHRRDGGGGRRCDASALLDEYRHRCPNRRAIFTLS